MKFKMAIIIFMVFFGCSKNPVNLADNKQDELILSYSYPLTAKEILQNSDYNYTVTIIDDIFDCGYWYDFWLTDRDSKLQFHIDTLYADSAFYGLVFIQSGYCSFNYYVDLTGWTLVVYTNYGVIAERKD